MANPEQDRQRPLALTMGDPAGIGLDITITAWTRRKQEPLPKFVLLADPAAVRERAAVLGLSVQLAQLSEFSELQSLPTDALPVFRIKLATPAMAGRADPANAAAVITSIEKAVAAVAAGEASGVVTNPISKATVYAAGFRHPGHTEFLGELAERHFADTRSTPVMMLASEELRVVPLTVHIALADVPKSLSVARVVETCRVTADELRRRFRIATPRIAVSGLNPHAGEGGAMGREEIDIIVPALDQLRREGLDVTGPLPADTMFHAAARSRYDAAVCMYHDQALIPLKTLAFDSGVNVTLGLPFVRTSPDHGTAFDIAGSGRANPTSLIAALRMAERLAAAATEARP